ncbi:hypothetical protein Tco_0767462 [Tanacetum coccineum]
MAYSGTKNESRTEIRYYWKRKEFPRTFHNILKLFGPLALKVPLTHRPLRFVLTQLGQTILGKPLTVSPNCAGPRDLNKLDDEPMASLTMPQLMIFVFAGAYNFALSQFLRQEVGINSPSSIATEPFLFIDW